MSRQQRRRAAREAARRPAPSAASGPRASGTAGELQQAVALHQAGRIHKAEAIYRRILEREPEQPEALHLLGLIRHQTERHAEACELIGKAIAVDADNALYHANLGPVLKALGRSEEAVSACRRAAALAPNFAQAHNHLGAVLTAPEQVEEAIAALRRAIALKPDHAEAHDLLGVRLSARGDFAEAVKCHEMALALNPGSAEFHRHLGLALHRQGNLERAAKCCREAIRLRPDHAETHRNLSEILIQSRCFGEAAEAAEKAVRLAPDLAEGRELLLISRQLVCQWRHWEDDFRRLVELNERDLAGGAPSRIRPWQALTVPLTPRQQHAIARSWSERFSEGAWAALEGQPFAFTRQRRGRLRVAYISSDFRDHPGGHLMRSLFGLHDRTDFEIYAYSFGPDDGSDYRKRIAADCDHFIDITELSYLEAARRIHADGIDIAIDRNGYTVGARTEILALRPAPIQVSYIAFASTMGAEFIDYVITDKVVTPPDQQPFFSEKFVYLPHCYLINDRWQAIADETPSRADCGLPEHGFVFCCFNNSYKIEPSVFAVWMRILKRVSESVLWLFTGAPDIVGNLSREAETRGVAGERLIFAERVRKADHLARHRRADLFLDTHICGAHTTGTDALWAGLPLITCPGETFVSRVSASLLKAVGLPELIVENFHDYEELAVRLAGAPRELQDLRQKLAANRLTRPLFDTERQARNLEQAYRMMWQLHEAGEPPRQLEVPDLAGGAAHEGQGGRAA